MLLYTGYNVITASLKSDFHQACRERGGADPAPVSIVQFLQSVRNRQRLPSDCVAVEGLIDLWEGWPDPDVEQKQQDMRQVLHDGRNWLEDAAYVICFVLPEGIELMPGDNNRLSVRLHGGRYIPLHNVFGRPMRVSDGHYRWAFSVDS
jgi:hypothetical protein